MTFRLNLPSDIDPDGPDPVLTFAAEHMQADATFVDIDVVYPGFEAAPDTLRVHRDGTIEVVYDGVGG